MRKFTILLIYCLCILRSVAQPTRDSANKHVKLVVILMRHGVRAPTWTNERLDAISSSPWPNWGVSAGMLTTHGASVLKTLGFYWAEALLRDQVISRQSCDEANKLYIYADTDERTIMSGEAMANGLFPACPPRVGHAANKYDILFHISKGGKQDSLLSAAQSEIAGDPYALDSMFRSQLLLLQRVLFASPSSSAKIAKAKNALAVPPLLAILTKVFQQYEAKLDWLPRWLKTSRWNIWTECLGAKSAGGAQALRT